MDGGWTTKAAADPPEAVAGGWRLQGSSGQQLMMV